MRLDLLCKQMYLSFTEMGVTTETKMMCQWKTIAHPRGY